MISIVSLAFTFSIAIVTATVISAFRSVQLAPTAPFAFFAVIASQVPPAILDDDSQPIIATTLRIVFAILINLMTTDSFPNCVCSLTSMVVTSFSPMPIHE